MFYKFKNKKIIITGHNGFKGSWLTLLLNYFGAKIYGVSLKKNNSNLFPVLNFSKDITNLNCDIKNFKKINKIISDLKPDYIFHLAAQPLVSDSYYDPKLTFSTNVIGTMNILDSVKTLKNECISIIITSDKCYKNNEWNRGYKENDILFGEDPYSASKSMCEILVNSYYKSFFKNNKNIHLATARAGNVIGGGDWSKDRLVPDIIKNYQKNKTIFIRNPKSTRPWQHVLEPLRGYLMLALKIKKEKLSGSSFNFGPETIDCKEVNQLVNELSLHFKFKKINYKKSLKFKESKLLKLNCSKAKSIIKWKPNLNFKKTILLTSNWYKDYFINKDPISISQKQIKEYFKNEF